MNTIRKYMFWMNEKGIQTYKITVDGKFELIKFRGEELYSGKDINKFMSWFVKIAAIAEDEYIDFCYLSTEPITSKLFEWNIKKNSSWDKSEVSFFCEHFINVQNYEVIIDTGKSFFSQSGNIYDEKNIKKLYLKCVPEFSFETEPKIEGGSEETSLVNRYFIEKLRELTA